MGRLSGHPNIVTILQVGATSSGRPYIVMPYYPKNSLEALIREHGPLDWVETLSVGVKLAGALDAAHRTGTLHRDVKPGNILLSDYGEPQLTDFGIARIAGGFQTSTGVITGSPAFTAPEVLEGNAPTPASDVYSLGATLFCALTGHAAFERRSGEQVVAQFLRITSQPVPDLREQGLPGDVAAIVERAMALDPAERPGSAAEFGDELREVQRRNQLGVDEMARPVDLGVERRTPATQASTPRRSSATTPPAPATKYRPSVPTRGLVPRPRLTDVLRAGGRRRLVLIHAPSGFGKSTLAAQWGEDLSRDGVAVAWLTIDDDDNNVVWFLTHLLESIRRVRPELADVPGPGPRRARRGRRALCPDLTDRRDTRRRSSDRGCDRRLAPSNGHRNDRCPRLSAGQRMPSPTDHRDKLVTVRTTAEQDADPRRARRNRFHRFAFRCR